jgi:hypothetical protein
MSNLNLKAFNKIANNSYAKNKDKRSNPQQNAGAS